MVSWAEVSLKYLLKSASVNPASAPAPIHSSGLFSFLKYTNCIILSGVCSGVILFLHLSKRRKQFSLIVAITEIVFPWCAWLGKCGCPSIIGLKGGL